MEPLDTDMEYMTRPRRSSNPAARTNVILILPIIGLLLILLFIAAAIFQLDLSGIIDSLVGLMLLFFIALVALLFWAKAPNRHTYE